MQKEAIEKRMQLKDGPKKSNRYVRKTQGWETQADGTANRYRMFGKTFPTQINQDLRLYKSREQKLFINCRSGAGIDLHGCAACLTPAASLGLAQFIWRSPHPAQLIENALNKRLKESWFRYFLPMAFEAAEPFANQVLIKDCLSRCTRVDVLIRETPHTSITSEIEQSAFTPSGERANCRSVWLDDQCFQTCVVNTVYLCRKPWRFKLPVLIRT